MNKVWVVGVGDCEGNRIVAVCSTKEIAERELFKARDELIKEYKHMDEYCNEDGRKDNMYKNMIKELKDNDYEKWDNYPHECPYLYSTELIGE